MARKAYRDGKTVMVCPCKLRPGTPWHPEVTVDTVIDGDNFNEFTSWQPEVTADTVIDGYDFDKFVLWFEVYNCNAQAGWYASFYVTE